jgi:RHS repeat-associated protein
LALSIDVRGTTVLAKLYLPQQHDLERRDAINISSPKVCFSITATHAPTVAPGTYHQAKLHSTLQHTTARHHQHDRGPKTSQPCCHRNQQYSIVGLTNAAGTLVERYTYTAYGTLGIYAADGTVRSSSSYNNRYTYTGREYDPELKLCHFRARWYDPATGGFISRDPLGYVDGRSLYRGYFVVEDTDPWGLCMDASIDTGKKDQTVDDMPVYTDKSLTGWSFNALNNVCFKVELNCDCFEEDENCHVGPLCECSIKSIQFKFFITISPLKVPILVSTYGHEQWHIDLMIKTIKQTNFGEIVLISEDSCDDCGKRLHELIWKTIGRGFMHNWDRGNPDGPPPSGLPPGGGGYPKGQLPSEPYPDRDTSGLPTDGIDGWFCSMDQVIKGGRPWPDIEFDPQGKGPWSKPPSRLNPPIP